MRASATFRTVSYASPQASQAKSNANPADGAFGQLLVATAPKQLGPQKDQKDTSDSGDKAADQASPAQQDNSSAAIQTPAQPSPRPATKTGKADKSDDQATAKTDNPADGSQNAAIDQQLAELQAVTPAPSLQAHSDGDKLALDKIAPAAQAGAPSGIPADAGIADPTAIKPSNEAAAQAAGAQQADDIQVDDLELQMSAAGSKRSVGQPPGAAVIGANDGNDANDVGDAAASRNTASDLALDGIGQNSLNQYGVGKGADSVTTAVQAALAKSDIAQGGIKDDFNKFGAARLRGIQNSGAAAGDKADTNSGNGSSASTAEVKTSSTLATLDSLQATAPKSAPPPMQVANTSFDISASAAPQQPGVAFAAVSTQHTIQVSAQPAPNLPALAVEIAARSQSGAKQFDIRLDPPELGRVDVRLSIDATGKASAHLSADQPHTLTLLQNDAPALTRALRDAGLDVSQNGLNFSLRQQAENNGRNTGDNDRRGTSRAFSLTATADIDATAMTAAYWGAANGRLDIRV